MNAITQIKFTGIIGSNNPKITKKILLKKLLELEVFVNSNTFIGCPVEEYCRLHLTVDEPKGRKSEAKKRTRKQF